MATVDLKDVRKVYSGNVEAVKGVSIAIPDGKLCVLVGPSGCGKSTLLRMIAGLEAITAGAVSIDGKVVNAVPSGERINPWVGSSNPASMFSVVDLPQPLGPTRVRSS